MCDRLRRPRRVLTLLVVLVALWCGRQVLPERAVHLYGFGKNQYARTAAAAPLPNRGEAWIVDMERMTLAWLEPGDRVAVWSVEPPDRIPSNQFDRMRLGYLMAPVPLLRSEDTTPAEVDWVYSSRAMSLAMRDAGWTDFEQVEGPRAHRLYRRIGGRADGRVARSEAESGLPDGGPPAWVQLGGVFAAMSSAWLAGWAVLLAWGGSVRNPDAKMGADQGRWRRPFLALVFGQLLVAGVMLAVNALGWAGSRVMVLGLVAMVVALFVGAGLMRSRLRGQRHPKDGASPEVGEESKACGTADAGSVRSVEGWLLCLWTFVLLGVGAVAAMSWHTNCLPGMGIWAHKAKLFHLAGGFPDGYFSEPGWSASQPGYPPLPALLMQWGYVWTGAVADRAVGVWNALWLAAACAWVMLWLRSVRVSAAAVWVVVPLLFLTGEMVRHWFERYAEPMFLLHALMGLGLVAAALGGSGGLARPSPADRARLITGLALVASTAWIKHEGVLLTLACGLALLPVVWRAWGFRAAGKAAAALAVCLLMAVSWLMIAAVLGAGSGHYDWGRPLAVPWEESRERLVTVWNAWRVFAQFEGNHLAGIWWMVPPLLMFGLLRSWVRGSGRVTDPKNTAPSWSAAFGWLVVVAVVYMLGLACIYLFSTQAFPWVMRASLTRGLMLPTLLLAIAGLTALAGGARRSPQAATI